MVPIKSGQDSIGRGDSFEVAWPGPVKATAALAARGSLLAELGGGGGSAGGGGTHTRPSRVCGPGAFHLALQVLHSFPTTSNSCDVGVPTPVSCLFVTEDKLSCLRRVTSALALQDDPGTAASTATWEPVGDAGSQAPPQTF